MNRNLKSKKDKKDCVKIEEQSKICSFFMYKKQSYFYLFLIEYAMHCGCKMIATIHGCSMEELRKKPLIGQMIKERRFERYIVLSGTGKAGQIAGIYDERGGQLC